jgi:hypothetical protein
MRKKQVALVVLLVGAAVSLSGCVVAAVGAAAVGTAVYATGDLEVVEAEKLDVVYDATLAAMRDLDLYVTKQTKDSLSAVIVARDAQDKKITIKLNAATSEVTELSIRVGAFGNEEKSRLIYKEIRRNLR